MTYFTITELLSGTLLSEVPHQHQLNLEILQDKASKFREARGSPLVVTSGYRGLQHHIDIYRTKARVGGFPFEKSQVPMGSKHLIGAAVDFADPDGSLYAWAMGRPEVLDTCNVFCELGTKGWVHIQIFPFGSYKLGSTRWFTP